MRLSGMNTYGGKCLARVSSSSRMRCIAREKQEGASFKEWLTLPDMGLLVSTAFNVILVNLSHGSASTFLPLRSTPTSSLHNRLIIAMANERNIHWVMVQLRVNAPLPSLYPSWDRYVEDCAKGWRDGFVFRDIAPIASSRS
ncbi:hypothetical protein Scep_009776 [Stephania cephalantha]|uniref:Uncharacterized protein n=1 Tax=Stephania cephalantha TaxID=152367 RepID=A0AAP0PGH3_9MAGN